MAANIKRNYNMLLILSLSINLLTIGYFAGKRVYYYNMPFFSKYLGINKHRVNISKLRWHSFQKNKADTADILFNGTSITEAFPLQTAFENPHIKNLGFGWNQTRHILRQASIYSKRHPRKVFLEGGVNDIKNKISIDTAFNNMVRTCHIINGQSPRTMVYVQSVLPTNTLDINEKIKQYNKLLAAYCFQNHITYIDLYREFSLNGKIDPYLTTDGIHLSAAGYFLWYKILKKYVTDN